MTQNNAAKCEGAFVPLSDRRQFRSLEPDAGMYWDGLLTDWVGAYPLDWVRNRVVIAMLKIALRENGGNYTRAAQLLGVRRQAVQQMVSRFELNTWVQSLREQRA